MATIYISNGGETVCADHGGTYLQMEIKHNDRAEIITPLDHWIRLTDADIADAKLDGLTDAELQCEYCEETP